jgi:hypothetical protein
LLALLGFILAEQRMVQLMLRCWDAWKPCA